MKQSSHKEAGNAVLTALLVILVVAAVVLIGLGIKKRRDDKKAAVITPAVAQTTSPASTTTAPGALANGTDNSSLNGDLTNINASLAQNSQSSNAANTAVSDQQQQVTVPTN